MDPVQFGQFLTEERKAKGWTQKELAERVGVSDKAVSKWERGICLPDVTKFVDIAAALGISDLEVFRAERFQSKESEAVKPEPLITWKQAGWLLLGCFCIAVVCFVGDYLELLGIVRIIPLFDLLQIAACVILGLILALRWPPTRNLSARGAVWGTLALVALAGLALYILDRGWFIWDTVIRWLTPGMDLEQRWAWEEAVLRTPGLWPPSVLLSKFLTYNIFSYWGMLALVLCFIVFLAIRLWRSLWKKKTDKTTAPA